MSSKLISFLNTSSLTKQYHPYHTNHCIHISKFLHNRPSLLPHLFRFSKINNPRRTNRGFWLQDHIWRSRVGVLCFPFCLWIYDGLVFILKRSLKVLLSKENLTEILLYFFCFRFLVSRSIKQILKVIYNSYGFGFVVLNEKGQQK